jgi:putative effector of murein hydrolase LrgA (UPF0299 family)
VETVKFAFIYLFFLPANIQVAQSFSILSQGCLVILFLYRIGAVALALGNQMGKYNIIYMCNIRLAENSNSEKSMRQAQES